jgi:ABC-type lipoprotein release transport system permease subunit
MQPLSCSIWTVMRESLALVALGITAALAIDLVAFNQISGSLFGLNATDPLSVMAATLVMILGAASAGLIPARRAAGVDPMVALRNELEAREGPEDGREDGR